MTRLLTRARRALGGLLGLVLAAVLLVVPTPAHAVDTEAYIQRVAPLAQREAAQYGVPASVAIGQSILETGWGGSSLATGSSNYFGIKCPGNGNPSGSGSPYVKGCIAKDSWEYTPNPVLIRSWFRTYASVEGSFLDHGYFLSTRSRYAAAFRYGDNPDQFIREVAKAGYATDPTYADMVIDIMQRYNLYRFDPQYDPNRTAADPGGYVSMSSQRVLDTRSTSALSPGQDITLKFAGRLGIPADAAAVAINLTSTDSRTGGYLVAYPTGRPVPATSTLNPFVGRQVANAAIVGLGDGGSVTIHSESSTQLVVDIVGYYLNPGHATPAGAVLPVTPVRFVDTRTTTVVGPGEDLVVDIAGKQGTGGRRDGTSISAVYLNLTVTGSAAEGFLAAYPNGVGLPLASNVNFHAGETVSSAAWVALGPDGRIRVRNGSSGAAHIVVDMSAYAVGGNVTMRGGFVPVTPRRLLDTRTGPGPVGVLPGNGSLGIDVSGVGGGVPVGAVALTLTATDTRSEGFLVAHPADRPRPLASTLNFATGKTVPNLAKVRKGTNGVVTIGSGAAGQVSVVADLAGYYRA